MADGSHLGFIQKPVTFEPFEITGPNLVSRLSSTPEFGKILNFAVFQKSKMANGSHLGFIQKLVNVEPFEITTPNLVSRFSTTPGFGQILKFKKKIKIQAQKKIHYEEHKEEISPRRQNMASRIKNTIRAY